MKYQNLTALRKRTNILDFDEQYTIVKSKIDKIFDDNKDCKPLFISIVGSTSYGLDLEKSDIDVKGIFIQDLESILGELRLGQANPLKYKNQIGNGETDSNGKIKQDIVFYEFGRFIELVQNNNPNILELLSTQKECIIYQDPIWKDILKDIKKANVLTKKCYYTFHNYASQQIKKATGLNKKINNPIDKVRKTPIDFCNVIFDDNSTMNLQSYLDKNQFDQRMCGLVKIPHAKDLYGLYYDIESSKSFSKYIDENIREEHRTTKREAGSTMGLGYKGIIKENLDEAIEVISDIRLSSVPKEEKLLVYLSYNKDGYLRYCKDYTAYWGDAGWVNMRSDERYNDNIKSGQNYDSKNLSHCLRLLYMANEIALGKGVINKRSDDQIKELLQVKKGVWSYEDIMSECSRLTDGLEEMYKNSTLPEEIDFKILSDIVLKHRVQIYLNCKWTRKIK